MNNINKSLIIFKKYFNSNKKKLTFKSNTFLGNKKYLPPVSKEWKNTIFTFNKCNLKNLPVYDININELIKSYFNLYLKPKYLSEIYRSSKKKFLSFNKIYVSKAEVKHTNTKAILTLYIYNREKVSLLKKLGLLEKSFYKKFFLINKDFNDNIKIKNLEKSFLLEYYEDLIILQRYKFKLNINKYKFEDKLLYKLRNLIFKIYNKKIEFNIVNMKSVILNSDFITKILTQKLKNKKSNILQVMNKILNKVSLPKTNNITERSHALKGIDFNLLENKFLNSRLSFILRKKGSFSKLIKTYFLNIISKNNFNKNYIDIYKLIFNSIKYKNISGARLEAKGRLSKRNRADRAQFKVRLKGGLKDIDSSYKKLSSLNFRGYLKSNLEYSIYSSKRTIGAFAVKGWVSGK